MIVSGWLNVGVVDTVLRLPYDLCAFSEYLKFVYMVLFVMVIVLRRVIMQKEGNVGKRTCSEFSILDIILMLSLILTADLFTTGIDTQAVVVDINFDFPKNSRDIPA
ncbi:hypothetical protein HS088_TW20G00497 [Tripterygium wilfordii]|uniref:Uncharacterized protein n=1 Tax=Tripterygium wilfordii TaxID=458696 RepID=A0A7J7C8G2_TRIWF|nr:hypothetical protein HS088_TW20G00497 [Tripterygium wilfordii]